MAGHQAGLWHPGILSKRFAIEAIAAQQGDQQGEQQGEQHRAQPAWLVVDQDDNDPGEIAFPTKTDGRWRRVSTTLRPKRDRPPPGTPTGGAPAFKPRPVERLEPTTETGVRHALFAAHDALAAHADAPTAAQQAARAVDDLLGDRMPCVTATELSETELFRSVVADIADQPDSCRDAFNHAVSQHPRSGLRPLREGELPLWRVADTGPRRSANTRDDVGGNHADTGVLPRGILMTLLARLAGCDLFLHGTGGLAYEPAADAWLELWRPASLEGITPAPFAGITADLRLPLSPEGVPTAADAARAHWLAHASAHSPALLGDDDAEQEKQRLLKEIGSLPRRHPGRAAAYVALHELLAATRHNHDAELQAVRDRAERMHDAYRDRDVLSARDWPFVFYSTEALGGLRAAVEAMVEAAVRSHTEDAS